MQRILCSALLVSALASAPALAEPMSLQADRYNTTGSVRRTAPAYIAPSPAQPARYASADRAPMGGGFIEFLFGGGPPIAPRPPGDVYAHAGQTSISPEETVDPRRQPIDPKFMKQVVPYMGKEPVGTIVIDTQNRFLFLVQGDGTALRYGIGVGRDGFTWAGRSGRNSGAHRVPA